MLSIIDKYIIKKFLSTFFFMLGIIMLLAMVFDVAERLSEFIENQAPFSEIMSKYYLNFILFYGNTYSSMIVFIAVIWFTAKMAQETEIIPILNSGKPFNRFLRPYFIGATILMLISLALNHFILPRSNKERLQFEEDYYRNDIHVSNYYAEFPGNEVVYYASFSARDSLCREFVVEKWNDKDELLYIVRARYAKNIAGTNTWILSDFYERLVRVKGDQLKEGKSKRMNFDFTIDDLAKRDNSVEAMTYSELKKFIKKERAKGSPKIAYYEIELHQRTSLPFATYVLAVIGVSVASRKKRGGIGINIAIGLGIVFIYIFAMKVTAVAAINVGFPTAIAVWIPNILFAGVAVVLYKKAVR
jgi:lipopolysaccharide export system permease protein